MTTDTKKPFISVMILCYNYSSLLKKALDACAKQTFRDFEIVMINNGSTDDTEKVFFDFSESHPGILTQYVLVQPNQGPTHGWNEGLKYAKGDYLLFNDADDWMEPNCLEELAKVAKESNADRIVGQYSEIYPDGKIHRIRKIKKKSALIPSAMLQGTLFKNSVIKENGIVFPKEVLIPYDFSFVYSFVNHESTVPAFVRKTVYNYFFNPQSISQCDQKKSDYLISLNNNYYPLIDITSAEMNKAKNERIKHEMEYLCVRNNYSAVFFASRIYGQSTAFAFTEKILSYAKEKMPEYKSNPLIFPVNNGYTFIGSFAVWILVKLHGLKLMNQFINIVSRFSHNKYYRKNTE